MMAETLTYLACVRLDAIATGCVCRETPMYLDALVADHPLIGWPRAQLIGDRPICVSSPLRRLSDRNDARPASTNSIALPSPTAGPPAQILLDKTDAIETA